MAQWLHFSSEAFYWPNRHPFCGSELERSSVCLISDQKGR